VVAANTPSDASCLYPRAEALGDVKGPCPLPHLPGTGAFLWLPDLLGPNGDGVQGQILVGSIAAALAAYASVRFLSRYFTTRTLLPFAAYCLVVGALAMVRFA